MTMTKKHHVNFLGGPFWLLIRDWLASALQVIFLQIVIIKEEKKCS